MKESTSYIRSFTNISPPERSAPAPGFLRATPPVQKSHDHRGTPGVPQCVPSASVHLFFPPLTTEPRTRRDARAPRRLRCFVHRGAFYHGYFTCFGLLSRRTHRTRSCMKTSCGVRTVHPRIRAEKNRAVEAHFTGIVFMIDQCMLQRSAHT
jgi:hypothetical protein